MCDHTSKILHVFQSAVSITVSNLSVILHPNKKNLTRFEIATSQILMLTHSKSEQPPNASVYGRGQLAKQSCAYLVNIKSSGCVAVRDHQGPSDRSKNTCTNHPRQNQYMWTSKCMRPESVSKSTGQHAQHKTPDFLGYCVNFSRCCCPQKPPQTTLVNLKS